MVRMEFRKNAKVKEVEAIEALKANAVRALSNYLLYESGSKDPRLNKRMKEQASGEGHHGLRAVSKQILPSFQHSTTAF